MTGCACPAVFAPPLPYAVGYSFSNFQALAPSQPLPAPRLDTELAGIAAATQALVCALQQIQRSDGALSNGLVTFDSLSPALVAQLGLAVPVPELFVAQVKIALSYLDAVGLIEQTISADPNDPVNILWTSGGPTAPADPLYAAIQAAMNWTPTQIATLYARATRLTSQYPASAVQVTALKLALAAVGQVGIVERQLPADPNNVASIIWRTGGLTTPTDALGQFLAAIGQPVVTLYASAAQS